MANHKSAEKRARQSIVRSDRNTSIRTRTKNAVRTLREKLDAGEKDADTLASAVKELQRAATKGVMHKRTAARRSGRLVRAFNKVQ